MGRLDEMMFGWWVEWMRGDGGRFPRERLARQLKLIRRCRPDAAEPFVRAIREWNVYPVKTSEVRT